MAGYLWLQAKAFELAEVELPLLPDKTAVQAVEILGAALAP